MDTGNQIRRVQWGRLPQDYRPMPDVGQGVVEIRIHGRTEHRVFYVAKFEEAVYVLHIFIKKSRTTATRDIDLGRQRYRAMLDLREKEGRP